MKALLTGRLGAASAGAITTLLLAGGGYAIASAWGKITACVHKHGGGLYVGHCARHDTKLHWNAVGPQGPQGLQGPQGAQGVTGGAGSALAYAHVTWNGASAAFDPTQSAGMGATTVTKRATSAFCFARSVPLPIGRLGRRPRSHRHGDHAPHGAGAYGY